MLENHMVQPLHDTMPKRTLSRDEATMQVQDEDALKAISDEPELCLHLADAFAELVQAEAGNADAIKHILQDVRAMRYVFVQRLLEE